MSKRTWGTRFCPAELATGHEGFTCIGQVKHGGFHVTVGCPPCASCGGMDMHTDWCPDIELVTDYSIQLRFNDQGQYWVEPSADNSVYRLYAQDARSVQRPYVPPEERA